MNKFRTLLAALSVAAAAFSGSAHASLIGDSINASGISLGPASATIGAGNEFTGISGYISFDFGADTLTVTSHNSLSGWSGFGNYVFTGFDDIINSFTLLSNNGFNASFISDFSFSANSLTLNMNTGSVANWQTGATAVFGINAAQVPEPQALLLMLSALGLMGAISRRRTSR